MKTLKLILAVFLLSALSGCIEEEAEHTQASNNIFVELELRAKNVLSNYCLGCHGANSTNVLSNILDTNELINNGWIIPGDANSSQLVQSVLSGRMPNNNMAMANDDREALASWVNAMPAQVVIPETATFAEVQSKILNASCIGCHGSTNVINLTSYQGVSLTLLPGNPEASLIYDSILHQRMPKNTNPISSENILLLRNWIAQGAINN